MRPGVFEFSSRVAIIFGCIFSIMSAANASAAGFGNLLPLAQISGNSTDITRFKLAQADDAVFRINQLDETIRRLNGEIEELNFQLLQMQEQMRRMQEDNEFRFQELEKRQGSLNSSKPKIANKKREKIIALGKRKPSKSADVNSDLGGERKKVKPGKKRRMIDGVEIYDEEIEYNGELELPLGTITFDSLGNVVDSAVGKPLDLTSQSPNDDPQNDTLPARANSDDEIHQGPQSNIASVSNAKQLFEIGYEYFQAGDYSNSQLAFAAFVERYPDNKKVANAQFWLGESMFSQSKFEEAAKVFLNAHTNWPEARIAPQTLLKLGVSLAGMQQRELACATYAKVKNKYPRMSNTLKKRVADEQKSAHCLNG